MINYQFSHLIADHHPLHIFDRYARSLCAKAETETWFRSNQLNKQTSVVTDFCYTNPAIVPGELLSRRGFSMYSGVDNNYDDDYNKNNRGTQYGTYYEARSKFWLIGPSESTIPRRIMINQITDASVHANLIRYR